MPRVLNTTAACSIRSGRHSACRCPRFEADFMPQHSEHVWLELVRTQVLRRNMPHALALLSQALLEYPTSTELRRTQAGTLQLAGRTDEAEAIFRNLLEQCPMDAAAAFSL